MIQTALEDVRNSEPFLPFPGSVLPALLALRKTHETIVQSKAYLAEHGSAMEHERRRLDHEKSELRDQNLLTEALQARLESLREELASNADLRPEDGARKRKAELQKKKKTYDNNTAQLMKKLNAFIDKQLSGMLAAEELGGPIVGDIMDVDAEDLASGFNAQGKAKKGKTLDDGKRQLRIDEIWGTGEEDQGSDEISMAGAEMRRLTEELLNQLFEAKGNNSAAYVDLARESAAARFLVRSKVAQFHPKNAMKLRLLDFGRELDLDDV